MGFDWCIERVKESSMYSELASELEITKALTYLRQNDVTKVSKYLVMIVQTVLDWRGSTVQVMTLTKANRI